MAATVLIVDDDRATLDGLARLLADAGYRILTAATFEAGQLALATGNPDVLLADIRLDNFNGLQLVATARSPVRAIVMTGYRDVTLEREARRFGAEYLVKPVMPDVLLATIQRQLETRPLGRQERRWPRKHLASALPIWVDQSLGRLIDISYGGARLEIDDRFDDLPPRVDVTLPTQNLTISADVIWKLRRGEAQCLCGAEIAVQDRARAHAWRELVDASREA